MSNLETRGASGQMVLAFELEEVSGTEDWRRMTVTLDATADGQAVILGIHEAVHRGRRRAGSRTLQSFALTPGDVIDLFRKHGRPL